MFEPKPFVGFTHRDLGLEQRAREADVALEIAKLHAQARASQLGLLQVDPGTRAGWAPDNSEERRRRVRPPRLRRRDRVPALRRKWLGLLVGHHQRG